MQEKKKQQPVSHAEGVARRTFIRKAVVGAAFAVPVIESFTSADMLARAATASTFPVWIITASVNPASTGTGTALPATQTVPNGGSAVVTATPTVGSAWVSYSIDGNPPVTVTGAAVASGGPVSFTSVTANHSVVVLFGAT